MTGQELSIQHADAEETEDKLMELWERRNLLKKGKVWERGGGQAVLLRQGD